MIINIEMIEGIGNYRLLITTMLICNTLHLLPNTKFKRKCKLNCTIGLYVCYLFKLNGLLQLEFNIILEFDRSIRQGPGAFCRIQWFLIQCSLF